MAATLTEAFDLNSNGVISLIGGGGKTSLMFGLAHHLAGLGKRVISTTTTKIFYPTEAQADQTLIKPFSGSFLDEVKKRLDRSPHLCIGSAFEPDKNKVFGFDPDIIDTIRQADLADWILVEADGARRKPIKASADHEPVLPECSSHIILVTGLDAVGMPLDKDHVHRPEIFCANTGLAPGMPVDEESLAKAVSIELDKAIALCEKAAAYLCLNKADDDNRKAVAKTICRCDIPVQRLKAIVTTCLTGDAEVTEILTVTP